MKELTQAGRKALEDIASRHNFSADVVEHVLMALLAGQGTQAQFNHPELGGLGQWSLGGMTMIGDMFNSALKARVEALCSDVSRLMQAAVPSSSSSQYQSQGSQSQGFGSADADARSDHVSLFVAGRSPASWWPDDLGHAASTGAQNQMRYAWFPDSARLAIDAGDGQVRVYDTGDHRIAGFSQQQSEDQSLSFTSQSGLVKLSQLREIPADRPAEEPAADPADLLAEGEAVDQAVHGRTEVADAAMAQPSDLPGQTASPPKPELTSTPELTSAPELVQAPISPPMPGNAKLVTAPATESDIFAKIERLAGLHAKGILNDEEFQSKKTELLARI